MTAPPIEVRGLSKRFGHVQAVDEVTFAVEPGRVTGFLGPNGAGKTTTLRMLLGLIRPSEGAAHIDGRRYRDLAQPARRVGAVIDIARAHPRMSAHQHLRTYAALSGLPAVRVDAVLELTGVAAFAHRRTGAFSTGMLQRLSLATALLGDPEILVLDEPANGLDPAGIAWLRTFLRSFVSSGRAVLLSSHILGDIEQTADNIVLIDRGRVVQSGELATVVEGDESLERVFLRATEGAVR